MNDCLDCGDPIVWDGDDGHCPQCRAAERRRTEIAALGQTIVDYRDDLMLLALACAPFVQLAKGIPHNWPGGCVLTIDESPTGNVKSLNYLKEDENATEPTIDDWRNLATVVARLIEGEEQTP